MMDEQQRKNFEEAKLRVSTYVVPCEHCNSNGTEPYYRIGLAIGASCVICGDTKWIKKLLEMPYEQ